VLSCGTWRAWEAGGGRAAGKGCAQRRWDIKVLATHSSRYSTAVLFSSQQWGAILVAFGSSQWE